MKVLVVGESLRTVQVPYHTVTASNNSHDGVSVVVRIFAHTLNIDEESIPVVTLDEVNQFQYFQWIMYLSTI